MRRVAVVIAVVTVWMGPAAAQGVVGGPPQAPQERAATGTGTVRGRVTTDTGQPVSTATVRLTVGPSSPPIAMPFAPFTATGTSDAEGRFEFTGVPAGVISVLADKSGYYNAFEADDAAARTFTAQRMRPLAAGQTVDDLVVTMARAGVITGKVLLPSGEPAERMYVEVMRKTRTPSGLRWAPAMRGGPATTDDTGAFRVFGLAPAEYLLSARPMNQTFSGPSDRDTTRDGVAVTYFPGTTRLADATAVTVKSGEETSGLVLSMAATKLASIRGRVVAPAGVDLAAVSVGIGEIVPDRMGGSMAGRRVAADGTFSAARLTPGRYRLTAYNGMAGPSSATMFASTTVDVDGTDLEDIVLTMTPGATFRGRVVTTTGDPLPPNAGLQVSLVRTNMELMGPMPTSTTVAADGTFRLEHVFAPGFLRLGGPTMGMGPGPGAGPAAGPAPAGSGPRPPLMLSSVRLAGRDVSDVPLDPEADMRDLTVVVTPTPAEVRGRVTGGAFAEGRRPLVAVFPEDEARWMPQSIGIRTAAVRADGTFSLRGLAAGDRYLIVAVEALESFDLWNDGMLASLRPAATPLRIEDGGLHEVALTAVPRPRP